MTSLPTLAASSTIAKRTSALIIGAFSGSGKTPTLILGDDILDNAAARRLEDDLVAVGLTGKAGEIVTVPAPAELPVSVVIAVGIGDESAEHDANAVRRAAGVAGRAARTHAHIATTLGTLDPIAAAEGILLGGYAFDEYRTKKKDGDSTTSVTLLLPQPKSKATRLALEEAERVSAAVVFARDLVNTPPNDLYPAEFAARAKAAGVAAGLTAQILDEKQLASKGFGGIVGVGQGSSRPPQLLRLTYKPETKKPKTQRHVALVGKGITFDTGGISIKPAANMDAMTSDMGGAAAVIAAIIAVAQLELPVAVTATVPMAENMPSATAQRPGDVLTQYGGTTVEVLNTDAEGRLILADAIVRAGEDKPDYLIDVATLTGAQVVALGGQTPGVMGTDDFRDRVAAISQEIGENAWPMPLPQHLREDLNSRVADLANVTPHRGGGMLSAGIFLREFVPAAVQWAHIDVAGPAFNSGGPFGYTPKGGTGVPVRTLVAVIADIASNG